LRSPSALTIADEVDTRNTFLGGQLGTRLGGRVHRLTYDVFGKVGLGWSHETATLSGATTLRGPVPGAGTTLPGGLLFVPSNSGHFERDDLAVVPEFGLQLGYDLAAWLSLTFGYSALYWTSTVRPGAQQPSTPAILAVRTAAITSFRRTEAHHANHRRTAGR